MTLKATREHFLNLIDDPDNHVIALTGKWGTGKSHLWREVSAESEIAALRDSVYVSLFGVASMKQLMLKLVQMTLPKAKERFWLQENLRTAAAGIKKVAQSFHSGFSALDELALLAVPAILSNRTIVLDDIERKHEKLSVDEVLGFIDEYTHVYGARFVLILNSDKLADRSVWDTMREKVVDAELELTTSPAEAMAIALQLRPTRYAESVSASVKICGITNIRVLLRTIKTVNHMLERAQSASDDVLLRVIPSTVLLCAIHYRGIEQGPDFDFVLQIGEPSVLEQRRSEEAESDQGDDDRARWRQLLQRLGIVSCGEFELLLIEYLRSGQVDLSKVIGLIDRFVNDAQAMRAHRLVWQFRDNCYWKFPVDEADLLDEARELAQIIGHVDAATVTFLYELVAELRGGAELADTMVDDWLAAFARRGGQPGTEDLFQRRVHPRIQARFDQLRAERQQSYSLQEACEYYIENSGWGQRQRLAINGTTVGEYEAAMKTMAIKERKLIMNTLVEMCQHRSAHESSFGEGMQRFVQACVNICNDPACHRLSRLIRLLFEDARLGELLPPVPVQQAV